MRRAFGRGLGVVGASIVLWGMAVGVPGRSRGAETLVAVSANFRTAAAELSEAFNASGNCRVVLSAGSSGTLYAQIRNGAPYGAFFSADTVRPFRLEREGFAVPGTRFTYASGLVTVWAPSADSTHTAEALLRGRAFRRLAIAMPSTAPYGAAAEQVLQRLGLGVETAPTIVRGESVTQAYQFVASGNAELGFVALAQVLREPIPNRWIVDASLYDPIRQQAVLLRQGSDDPCTRPFLAFVQSAQGREIIQRHGYGARAE